MKGKLITTAMAAVMLIVLMVSPLTVYAEDYTGGDGWNVTFDGEKMTSSFKSADIDEQIYERLQPGDSIELHVDLKNTYNGETDWYMSNEVLKSLEDSQSVAEGGAYTYLLKYISAGGTEKVLYDSENVGGEDKTGGEGLHQATDSLDEYLYLDRVGASKSGKVVLKVSLDGETQGNAYQNTLAVLQMNFAVELVDNTPVIRNEEVPGETTTPTPSQNVIKPPKTGDETPVMWFSIVTLVAGLTCVVIVIIRIVRSRRNEKEAE